MSRLREELTDIENLETGVRASAGLRLIMIVCLALALFWMLALYRASLRGGLAPDAGPLSAYAVAHTPGGSTCSGLDCQLKARLIDVTDEAEWTGPAVLESKTFGLPADRWPLAFELRLPEADAPPVRVGDRMQVQWLRSTSPTPVTLPYRIVSIKNRRDAVGTPSVYWMVNASAPEVAARRLHLPSGDRPPDPTPPALHVLQISSRSRLADDEFLVADSAIERDPRGARVWIAVAGWAIPVAVDEVARNRHGSIVREAPGSLGFPIRDEDWRRMASPARRAAFHALQESGQVPGAKLLGSGRELIDRPILNQAPGRAVVLN